MGQSVLLVLLVPGLFFAVITPCLANDLEMEEDLESYYSEYMENPMEALREALNIITGLQTVDPILLKDNFPEFAEQFTQAFRILATNVTLFPSENGDTYQYNERRNDDAPGNDVKRST